MRVWACWFLLLCMLASTGCGKKKTTDELIEDLKSSDEKDRIAAARLLTSKKEDAAKVVPALIEALKDKEGDVRRSVVTGLGMFGEDAKGAIPALKAIQVDDKDARIRSAASAALARIEK